MYLNLLLSRKKNKLIQVLYVNRKLSYQTWSHMYYIVDMHCNMHSILFLIVNSVRVIGITQKLWPDTVGSKVEKGASDKKNHIATVAHAV